MSSTWVRKLPDSGFYVSEEYEENGEVKARYEVGERLDVTKAGMWEGHNAVVERRGQVKGEWIYRLQCWCGESHWMREWELKAAEEADDE